MHIKVLVGVPLACAFLAASSAAVDVSANAQKCATRDDLADKCYETRGRLSFYNGTPSFRIWKVGTKRIIGVREEPENQTMPADLFYGTDANVFADFTVCPFTKDKAGWMQFVCVQSAKNIRVERYDPDIGETKKIFVKRTVELGN